MSNRRLAFVSSWKTLLSRIKLSENPQSGHLNRRAFSQSAMAAALLIGSAARSQESEATPSEDTGHYLPFIEARADALRHNAAAISAATAGRQIVAVVKTNGYGLGDVAVARALDDAPDVWGTMVVRPEEALRLAEGGVRKPILLMGARVDPSTAAALVTRGIRLSLTSLDEISMLAPLAGRQGGPIPVHLEIDTGYGRMGALYAKAETWARELADAKHLLLEGVSTYYVDDDEISDAQVERFNTALQQIRSAGLEPSIVHAPHSNPILERPQTMAGCNATRPGLILYGVYPNERKWRASQLDLQVAHRLMTRVLRVERLEPGHGAISGLPIELSRPRTFATIGIGVHDGLRYSAPTGRNKRVEIRGRLYNATEGRNYNHMIIDLGEAETDVAAGDVVKIFSWERPELHPNADVGTAYWQAFYGPDIRRTMT